MTADRLEAAPTARTRSGGRAGRKAARAAEAPPRAPYIQRRIATFEVLSAEGLELIEAHADEILKETGMEFRGDPEILSIFREAGADVKGDRVRFEPGMCRKLITATAPHEVIQHARNPANSVVIGGANTVLAPGWGPPFIHNLDEGRRYATYDDFCRLIKIHQMIPEYHHSGGVVVEPVDLPANKRHLDMLYAHFRWSDRALFGALIGEERAQDSVNMAKIVFGDDFVAQELLSLCGLQHQRAAGHGPQHVGLAESLCPQQPGGGGDAVDADRCHEPVHAGRHPGAGAGRGAGRAGAGAAHQSRRAVHDGNLRLDHVDAVGRADVWNT